MVALMDQASVVSATTNAPSNSEITHAFTSWYIPGTTVSLTYGCKGIDQWDSRDSTKTRNYLDSAKKFSLRSSAIKNANFLAYQFRTSRIYTEFIHVHILFKARTRIRWTPTATATGWRGWDWYRYLNFSWCWRTSRTPSWTHRPRHINLENKNSLTFQ